MTDTTQDRLEELRERAKSAALQCGPGNIEEWAVDRIERFEGLCKSLVGEELLHQEGQYTTEMDRLRATLEQQQAALLLAEEAAKATLVAMGRSETTMLYGEKGNRPKDFVPDDQWAWMQEAGIDATEKSLTALTAIKNLKTPDKNQS